MEAKIIKDFPRPESLGLVEAKNYASIAASHLIPQNATIKAPEIVFSLKDIPLLTKKSISLLKAQAKAGKTTVAAWIIAQAIQADTTAIWIDTEQGEYYGSRTQSWILQIAEMSTSKNLFYYDLKIHNPTDRVKIIEAILEMSPPDLLVIDGVRDLVFDINSPEESTNTATTLMKWADTYNIHILTILHQNKGNENARGHLGSEMVNKAETVIKVSQNEAKQIIVEPELTRGRPFEAFALLRDDEGIPSLSDLVTSNPCASTKIILPVDIDPGTHEEIVTMIFNLSSNLRYAEVIQNIKGYFELHGIKCGDNKAKGFCTYYQMQGLIIKDDSIQGYAKYKSGLKSKVV